jgi:hypothetical protein
MRIAVPYNVTETFLQLKLCGLSPLTYSNSELISGNMNLQDIS